MSLLPWELEDEICKMVCHSFIGLLNMRGVCKRWEKLVNEIHAERVLSIHLAYLRKEGDPAGLLRKLLLNSIYRTEVVRDLCIQQRKRLITEEFNGYLAEKMPGFVLTDLDDYEFMIKKGSCAVLRPRCLR